MQMRDLSLSVPLLGHRWPRAVGSSGTVDASTSAAYRISGAGVILAKLWHLLLVHVERAAILNLTRGTGDGS